MICLDQLSHGYGFAIWRVIEDKRQDNFHDMKRNEDGDPINFPCYFACRDGFVRKIGQVTWFTGIENPRIDLDPDIVSLSFSDMEEIMIKTRTHRSFLDRQPMSRRNSD